MKLISTNYIPKNSLCVSHNSKVINLQKMPLCVQLTNTPSLLAIILDLYSAAQAHLPLQLNIFETKNLHDFMFKR